MFDWKSKWLITLGHKNYILLICDPLSFLLIKAKGCHPFSDCYITISVATSEASVVNVISAFESGCAKIAATDRLSLH